MKVFDVPRSLITAFKCKWLGWARKKVFDNRGRECQELKLICRSPELNVQNSTLFTCSDVCRVCEFWEE